jgi:hypothetical protein
LASPKSAAPEPEAAIPARKTISPPGKTRPINNPVSIKIMPRTPINPRVDRTALASSRFVMFDRFIRKVRVSARWGEIERDLSTGYLFICKKATGYA